MQWNQMPVRYMKQDLYQVQNQEQTLELRLPDGMPEIESVLGTWGQCIVRSKEWRSDCLILSGGIHAWVLYGPENGQEPQSAECWLPFQIKWNLPDSRREGVMRVQCLLRNVEARILSSRKMMVRATVSALAEALEMAEETLFTPAETENDIQLLEKTYPMLLAKEAGEKLFTVEEDVDTAVIPEKLMAWDVMPYITEENVVGDKAVFRGGIRLHLVYMGQDSRIHAEYTELPFSQYAELEEMYDKEAVVTSMLAVSNVEPEMQDGHLRVKCMTTVQYIVSNTEDIMLAEDAYSPFTEVNVTTQSLTLQCCLEDHTQQLAVTATLPESLVPIDLCYRPEQTVLYPEGDQVTLEIPGVFQLLGYNADGKLVCITESANQQILYPAAENCSLCPVLTPTGKPEMLGNEMSAQLQMTLQCLCKQEINMITSVKTEDYVLSEDRPSIILRRAEDSDLWKLAKQSGSTVAAIRKANGLNADPAPGQMLLIPVC